jgi:hypothetical protein
LLYGFLEQLHTLTASAVDKVANDLRDEIAVVTEAKPAAAGDVGKTIAGEGVSMIVERLAHLEKSVDKHERLIRRAIEIAAHYFQG